MRTLVALTLLVPATAIAWEGRVVAEGQLGFAAPSGFFSTGLDVSVTPHVAVNAAGGLSVGGPQWSAMTRLQLPLARYSVGFGLGMSGGPWKPPFVDAHFDHAVWGNAELSLIWLAGRSVQFRAAGGYGAILNDESCEWTGFDPPVSCEVKAARYMMPYTQFALGYVF